MEFLATLADNLLSPAFLFFVLGIAAGFLKSDLEIPQSISRYLAIYLMMAIGFKGGAELAAAPALSAAHMFTVLAGMGMSALTPFVAFALLRASTRIRVPTAAAVAAHYGSVSMVTFATAAAFLTQQGLAYDGMIVAVLALMEAPAILTGLYLAHRAAPETRGHGAEEKKLSREIFTNGAILLLLGAFVIGWISGPAGMQRMEGFLVTPFQGILALFLLDMGLLVAKNLHQLRALTPPLLAFGFYMPLLGGGAGLLLATAIGLDAPTGMLFTVLCASASYIAVPAAMRLALPEAEAGVYLPLSLAVTFPFNIALGIPLYHAAAQALLSGG